MSPPQTGFVALLNHWGDVHWDFAAAMFVQVGVLVGVLLCLDVIALRRGRAAVRYAVWTLVLVKLILPVSLSSPFSMARWLPDVPPLTPTNSMVQTEHVSEGAAERLSETGGLTTPQALEAPITPTWPAVHPHEIDSSDMTEPPAGASEPATRIAAAASAETGRLEGAPDKPSPALVAHAPTWRAYVFLAWAAAVIVLTGLLLRRILLIRRMVSRSEDAPQDVLSLLADCLKLAGVAGERVRLRVSDELGSPAICGLWRATILLPRPLLEKLDREQMRLVIVYELMHWRRCDLQVNCLQTVLQVVYFYNPLVWLANLILRRAREQAVDEAVLVTLNSQPQQYSSTLLDIVSIARRPAELPLRMLGVVESRKALAGRIQRMLTRPLPRRARLGAIGLAAVVLAGVFLLPMGRNPDDAAVAAPPPASTANDEKQPPPAPSADAVAQAVAPEANEPASVLSGRIIDEAGAPVTDAQMTLSAVRGRERIETQTDEDGFYRIEAVELRGDYRLQITSERWVGINYRDQEIVNLAPNVHKTRDFRLQRACRVRVCTIDEEGRPIRGVRLMANSLAGEDFVAPETVSTDKEGWATIGGLAPSDAKYLIATMHDDYGFERLLVTLNNPAEVPAHFLVLRKGKDVHGTAVCSDGKPPAGWRILALPSWWHFGRYPGGQTIAEDGSFTLPHIVPGEYDVRIYILRDGGSSTPVQVLKDADVWSTEGPLKVKMDHPSPASLVYITGRVRFNGEMTGDGFWIFANSTDNQTHTGVYLRNGQKDFRLGPVPKGTYNIRAERVGLEAETLRVTAPAEDVELVVTAKGQPKLRGTVVEGETNGPVTNFRVRVTKLQTLSGPNYVQDANWREFSNENGAFEIDVNGPGIYQVLVAADGFAWTQSDPVNTVEQAGRRIEVALTRGVSLSGIVVDEEGNPVDGATVLALSKAAGSMVRVLHRIATQDGAVKTENGRFVLPHLAPGKDTLKVTHPDYCFAVIPDVVVGPERGDEPLTITLTRGGTVQGHVYDAAGQPEPHVTLYFQDEHGYGGNMDQEAGRFATAVTDVDGYYEVRHLPEQLCYVHRAEEWETLGVVRHCILPENGRTHTLDFGGTSELTGRLSINGEPLADGRVLLSGESPNFGIFKASAQTDGDGSFTFRGIPPGKRTLYYRIPGRRNDWGRLREIVVTAEEVDLGVIDHRTGSLTVRLEPAAVRESAEVRVTLQEYNPIWPFGNDVGSITRQNPAEPFVIDDVPPGTYELVVYVTGLFQVRKRIEVTAANLHQELRVHMPTGTASLSGRMDGRICGPHGCSSLKVWSPDGGLLGYIIPQKDGDYRLDNIPAGDYLIRDKDTRNAPVLLEVSLREGEQRTLDFTPDNVSPTDMRRGFLQVRVFTEQGVPLPCDVHLEGPAGKLTPHGVQNGHVSFVEPPGTYTLVVAYPGFAPIRRNVEMKPTNSDGRPADGFSVHVHLKEQLP